MSILKVVASETIANAGDKLAAPFDMGAGCAYGRYHLHAVSDDGRAVGVNILHGTTVAVDALASSPLVCEHNPYCFTAEKIELDFFRYLDVRAIADGTIVTLSRVTS